ncbi:hypothetical protein AGMMS50225_26500 [Betaproteobacteria bacterium]|nr:hypothetical protein AGMMS50225_26500 [Betaproteobacteria bacterium]
MPGVALLYHLVRDGLARQRVPRIPEPTPEMNHADSATAFCDAGATGMLAPTYLYHAIQASTVIPPGAQVIDLGCGPATQLALIARLNPHARFLGIDAAPTMLALGRDHLRHEGLHNVELIHGDMTRADGIAPTAADVVISTMALHHLPDTAALAATLRTIRRILKPGGGLYLVDFGRLKRAQTMHFFAHQHAAAQSELFTLDYLHSLHAAFSLQEWRTAAGELGPFATLHHTFLVPFLVALLSPRQPRLAPAVIAAINAHYASFSREQRREFDDLARFFAHGGLKPGMKPRAIA